MHLRLEDINLKLGDFALKSVHLEIPAGAYHMIAGPSGAGKSVLLELIAGLYIPDKGTIMLNQRDVTAIPVQQRHAGLLFQDNTLFPHLSVYDNIAFPHRIRNNAKSDCRPRIQQLADELGIDGLLNRRVMALSGGEIQRVSLARLLMSEPEVLLLDEPLSAVDIDQRRSIMGILLDLNQKGMTILHVTHEVDEVMRMASTVSLMQNGRIVQTGTLDDVSRQPKDPFVARFFGIRNVFDAEIHRKDAHTVCTISPEFPELLLSGKSESGPCRIFFPSDALSLVDDPGSEPSFAGIVREVNRYLNRTELEIEAGCTWVVEIPVTERIPVKGEQVRFRVDVSRAGFMPLPG